MILGNSCTHLLISKSDKTDRKEPELHIGVFRLVLCGPESVNLFDFADTASEKEALNPPCLICQSHPDVSVGAQHDEFRLGETPRVSEN